ncbi:uncharacterized protein LOC113517845 isoform X1 [Galleria mellonella]|uniref:Uncharacterized protein LOC113517845 isoform X1 n=1 Tax=Galleria mellonella TaxID=7137 RepID=A0A6J3C4T7_GALME|nr:uncharacterized protein LOC113517845 isoform X1 [Galleria mellonella]
MAELTRTVLLVLILSVAVLGKHKKVKPKKLVSATTKGIQCYNCLSFDHPGCWDPDHPYYANITVPNIDCYIPGMAFLCIVITSESAKLVHGVHSGQRPGDRSSTRAHLRARQGLLQEDGVVLHVQQAEQRAVRLRDLLAHPRQPAAMHALQEAPVHRRGPLLVRRPSPTPQLLTPGLISTVSA